MSATPRYQLMRNRSGRRRRQQDPMRRITFQPRYRRRPNALLD